MTKKVIVGARKSPLAQLQAQKAILYLGIDAERVGFTTSGDRIQDRDLRDSGGKELFVREVEQALLAGEIDLAVHSLKDLPARTPQGLALAAILPRENPFDALVSAAGYKTLDELPTGANVGTASPRRKAQLLHYRSDLKPVLLRGNVGSRLDKIFAGELDAAVLAMAGLVRLGQEDKGFLLSAEVMLPAAAQGAIGVQCRFDDRAMLDVCRRGNDPSTQALCAAERQFSSSFGASCHTPVAALAEWTPVAGGGRGMTLTAQLLTPDGTQGFKKTFVSKNPLDPIALGEQAAHDIKALAGEELIALIANL